MLRAWAVGISLATLACSGCGQAPEPGTIWLTPELAVAPRIDLVRYEVSSAAGTLLAQGALDVSAALIVPALQLRVRPGYRHTVVLTAAGADGSECTGASAPFDVAGRWITGVTVPVVCGSARPVLPPRTRPHGQSATGGDCPALTLWRISPLATSAVVGSIDVAAAAADADPGDLLSYSWTATAGSFGGATHAEAVYTCGRPGPQTLMVTVSDNHEPVPCTSSVTIPVTCRAP